MTLRIDILSLFPGYFSGPFQESMLKRAQEKRLLEIGLIDLRDFSSPPHWKVDDRPYGGGPGMVLMPAPTIAAVRSVKRQESRVVFLTPHGTPLTAKRCKELAQETHLVLLCGHYEGMDQRVVDLVVDEEISIGDYVLTNGCAAAVVLVDATVRFIPGVLGHELSAEQDSFQGPLLDCPHYTRPEVFEGRGVPEVLLSGHHERIAAWRQEQAMEITRRVRPDLWAQAVETEFVT